MPEARKIPLPIASGVVLSQTEYEAQGRWTSMDNVRFIDGQPEKVGGYEQWNTPGTDLIGACRSIFSWEDFVLNLWTVFGTTFALSAYNNDKIKFNITPIGSTGTLGANPFVTTAGSAVVRVVHADHGIVAGQIVTFSGATAFGGITISGSYVVDSVNPFLPLSQYYITHSVAAASTAGGGGASVAFSYDLAPGNAGAIVGGGWGIGTWGAGTWGTERSLGTYIQLPRYWSLDKYGQYLLAMPSGGGLYEWQVDVNARAVPVTNAPTIGNYMFITSERIVVVLGAGGDNMRMDWCDDDDNTVWTPADNNTANSRRLQDGSRLIAGTRVAQGVNLVWSDTTVYLMQFTGTNAVYSTRVVGSQSGIIGPGAFTVVDGIAFWMAANSFHMYAGQLNSLPRWEEVRSIFNDISDAQRFNVACHYNPKFREVWWTYPSTSATEPDKYVMVNIDTWDWAVGSVDRTVFGLRSILGKYELIGTDPTGVIYQHEVGVDADGIALDWHIESGYFDLENGNSGLNIDGYIPNWSRHTGNIALTFTSRDLPEDTVNQDVATASIAVGDTIKDVRHFGRQAKIRLSQTGVVGGTFGLGAHRLEVTGTPTKRND
jgi:hypothetical protein